MRLLDSSTLELHDFPPNQIPRYAILSHTWGDEEVSFLDLDRRDPDLRTKAGYAKLRYSCAQAIKEDIQYVWIDTCCIDKRSSAELSEAINSMFAWYQQACICYAYMTDVVTQTSSDDSDWVTEFLGSRWFKRGWTLQELIAPQNVVFYSVDWKELGHKSAMCDIISTATGIDADILNGKANMESASVAQRMSWAADRDTTRPEDKAYCLMGIFSVNMAMLYGEGDKAFLRLQEEIMKTSNDQSLFAWEDPKAAPDAQHGLLADSPAHFANCQSVVPMKNWESPAFSMTNKGLSLDVPLARYDMHDKNVYIAALDCPAPDCIEGQIGIFVKRLSAADEQFARVKCHTTRSPTKPGRVERIYVRQAVLLHGPRDIFRVHVCRLSTGPSKADGYEVLDVLSRDRLPVSTNAIATESASSESIRRPLWIPQGKPFQLALVKGAVRLAGALLTNRLQNGCQFWILLGSMKNFEVGFDVVAHSKSLWPEESMVDSKATLVSTTTEQKLVALERLFHPQGSGTAKEMDGHSLITVNITWRVFSRTKYYNAEIIVRQIGDYSGGLDELDLSTSEPNPFFKGHHLGTKNSALLRASAPIRSFFKKS